VLECQKVLQIVINHVGLVSALHCNNGQARRHNTDKASCKLKLAKPVCFIGPSLTGLEGFKPVSNPSRDTRAVSRQGRANVVSGGAGGRHHPCLGRSLRVTRQADLSGVDPARVFAARYHGGSRSPPGPSPARTKEP
jgi:hypothetical protein